MKIVFNNYYFLGNEIIFWTYIVSIIIMIILAIIFVIRENKNEHK